ncbi:MAG: hypothetical protein IPM24_02890 [Bryobacterales bacterium]|nr:hypothetical protein [Bryobacterales bacterium]
MALNESQTSELQEAIAKYAFPAVYFDFRRQAEVRIKDMGPVETAIRKMLTSDANGQVLDGLANVLYWGYAQVGYRDRRVRRFRAEATEDQLNGFRTMLGCPDSVGLAAIAAIKLPEFSGVSFVSKILAFLDPVKYCVLDRQLVKLATRPGNRALHRVSAAGTQIRITAKNRQAYDEWREECASISTQYFNGRYRAVDIERGFFQLVQAGRVTLAQELYVAA